MRNQSFQRMLNIILIGFFHLIFFLSLSCFITCNNHASGPSIPETQQLTVFCILNPALSAQTLNLQRSLSFNEIKSRIEPNLNISSATIEISNDETSWQPIQMLPESGPAEKISVHLDTDFLSGSGNFNYLFNRLSPKSNQKYQLWIHSEEYGSVTAETEIPSSFKITEINDIEFDYENSDESKPVRVTWSKSLGAAGYLADLTLLVYDLTPWLNLRELTGDTVGIIGRLFLEDSAYFKNIPWQEIPINLHSSPNYFQRGFLTQATELEIPRAELLDRINFPIKNSLELCTHIFIVRVNIHAVSKALYDFIAFQFLHTGPEQMVGQEAALPDLSNISGGLGVLGGAYSQTGLIRITQKYHRFFGMGWFYGSLPDSNINEVPTLLQPPNEIVLPPGAQLQLAWEPLDEADMYLLVLKPHYLWFWPGNRAFVLKDNFFEIRYDDIPFADCKVAWYVKGIKDLVPGFPHTGIIEIPSDKNSLIMNNYYRFLVDDWSIPRVGGRQSMYGYQPLSIPRSESDWSETRYFNIPSGDLAGFEDIQPVIRTPDNNAKLSGNIFLSWTTVTGAQSYLIYITAENGDHVIAVTSDTHISPPFADECDFVDGLRGLEQFAKDVHYTVRVCALRVKTGALGFAVGESENGQPPRIYPRYQHPSGIMLQSRWSETVEFQVLSPSF